VIAAPRVLLVGHDASRTGAPIASLTWTRWAAASGSADVEVLLDRGGPLAGAFADAAPTRVRAASGRAAVTVADTIGPDAGRWVRRAAALAAGPRSHGGTVVAVTAAAWRSAAALTGPHRLVLWLHELDGVADRLVPPAERAALLAVTARIVAVSDEVAAMVVDRWRVPTDRVSVVPSFVDGLHGLASVPPPPLDLVAVGSLVPRKGADQVVALAALVARDRPRLRCAWVGGDLGGPFADLVRADIAAAGLGGQFDLPGEVADVGPWWPTEGLVVHLAREDPAPLVAVEAGLRQIPVVTWDTGGAASLVRSAGLGHLVAAPGDLAAVARAVIPLLDDAQTRSHAGAALEAQARLRVTEQLAPALLRAFVGDAS
jgi:glycosyltransferase involved in cell wall biosynthesis